MGMVTWMETTVNALAYSEASWMCRRNRAVLKVQVFDEGELGAQPSFLPELNLHNTGWKSTYRYRGLEGVCRLEVVILLPS